MGQELILFKIKQSHSIDIDTNFDLELAISSILLRLILKYFNYL